MSEKWTRFRRNEVERQVRVANLVVLKAIKLHFYVQSVNDEIRNKMFREKHDQSHIRNFHRRIVGVAASNRR